ncbi:IclR family transcriptional regulator [Glutamicibacter sp. 287]|uniref:IclR family transcriptional regulator n=1 Tax=unclassified Glutamicibacter TaxID=2627139 RepID=UPI004033F53A
MTAFENEGSGAPHVDDERTPEVRGASVIVNVIDVLRCFTVERQLVGVTEIAAEVGLHKSSVSRILAALVQERIVERDEPTRKFRLGLGLIAIAGPLLANLDVRQTAYLPLKELAESVRETAVLNIWDGHESVSVEQIPSSRPVKHTSAMGSRYNTALSATVQLFLAYETPDSTRELLENGSILLQGDLSAEQFLDRISVAQNRGYAVNYGETSPEEVGVAAPIFNHRGEVVASVLIAAPFFRITPEILDELITACVGTARQISQRMGYTRQLA